MTDEEEPEPLMVRIRLEPTPGEKVWLEQRRQERDAVGEELGGLPVDVADDRGDG